MFLFLFWVRIFSTFFYGLAVSIKKNCNSPSAIYVSVSGVSLSLIFLTSGIASQLKPYALK